MVSSVRSKTQFPAVSSNPLTFRKTTGESADEDLEFVYVSTSEEISDLVSGGSLNALVTSVTERQLESNLSQTCSFGESNWNRKETMNGRVRILKSSILRRLRG